MFELEQGELGSVLAAICKDKVVVAFARQDLQYHLVRADEWDPEQHTLGSYRPVEPLKAILFPPRERVGDLRGTSAPRSVEERIAVGVKNCDLSALRVHDHVFLKTDPPDPYYAEARRKTIIVSCDCTDAREACFCPVVNEQPYAKAGFDINLSPAGEKFVVEAGSERGEALLGQAGQFLKPAGEETIARRDAGREAMTRRVCEQAEARGLTCGLDLRAAIEAAADSDMWDDFARDCVECGACNFVCCTCHCFLLADGKSGKSGEARVKKWDSCLYRNFARVAGGANPRKHRAERLYNRFEKKFSFFPEILGTYACDGCGRCAEACTGEIDIREVLKRAVNER